MSLLRWLREFFPKRVDDADDAFMEQVKRKNRSANICLASHGATRREKNFARRWM